MPLSFTRRLNRTLGVDNSGDIVDAAHINELQEALEDISLGTVPIPLAGIASALQSGGYTNGAGQITTAAITPALEGYGPLANVATDDSPADSLIVRSADGTPRSVAAPYVYAEARGVVMGDAGAADNNAVILQAILDEGKIALLPRGSCYYSATLIPKTNSGLIGASGALTKLVYTGSDDGIRALKTDRSSGVYRVHLRGFWLLFAGSGTGHGINFDVVRYSELSDVSVSYFNGSGLLMDGVSADGTGCWSNRFFYSEFFQNGRHGIEVTGIDANANYFFGVHTSRNALDGVYAEKARGWHWGIQSEANGRHAFNLRGVRAADLSPVYVEHQDPNYLASDLKPPGVSVQSPRYCVKLGAAPDGTRCGVLVAHGVYFEGAHGNNSTVTDHIIFAEDTDYLGITFDDTANTNGQRMFNIASSVGTVERSPNRVDSLNPQTIANQTNITKALYGDRGAQIRKSRGAITSDEGFDNLLVNGGFDTWTTAPGVPDGWTQIATGTYDRETGTDGGYRAVLTNSGTNQSGILQVLSGREVLAMIRHGKGVLVFDAIVPTTNTQDAQVNVQCRDSGNNVIGGYHSSLYALERTDAERTFELQFNVPASTDNIRVLFFASRNGASNTDVLKIDRAALYAGEIPKDYSPRRLVAPVTPAVYTVTNGTTDRAFDADSTSTAELADVLGTLLADLKAAGIVG